MFVNNGILVFDSDSIILYGSAMLWKVCFKSWVFKVDNIHIVAL